MDVSNFVDGELWTGTIWPMLVSYLPRVVGLFVALFAAKLLSSWTARLVNRSLAKADEALRKFLASLARYGVLTIGVVTALGYVGIETASFAAVIAASGLAIGLAFQGTLSNFSAGVMLLLFRPFKVGDYVKTGGEEGIIVEIDMFQTELKSLDNKRIIVPNSAIFGAVITNYTHYEQRRVDVSVGTEYGADLNTVRQVLEEVASRVEGGLDSPTPQVFLAGLGSSSVDWQVRVWCDTEDYWAVYQTLTRDIKQGLDGAGIGIPFPQQDVHFDDQFIKAVAR